ncbi:response regulator [Pseudomonas sp. LABIM340]|uniref:Response regulator n=1 Tax=Pseudomonas nitroreducens TaxID=46680 RepID=A0A5R9A064_PSENT|nr:response regulator [Pseudomonas nitroreducens]TLP71475.1 response regulator [Pseudomonas nitroreducens]
MQTHESKMVLVLEERPEQLQRLEDHLLGQGHAVLSALSEEEAIEHLVSSSVIDLFLIDEQLTGPLTGAALIEACLPLRPRMRVLVLSPWAEKGEEGAPYPVLPKSADLDELEGAIQRTLLSPPVQPWMLN